MKIFNLIFLSAYLTLVGCGQSGALYLPSKNQPIESGHEKPQTPAPATNNPIQ